MQQLSHRLKDGKMEVTEVAMPVPARGQVLVRNHFSVISAGTEGRTASDARKGYVAKAIARQDELKKVIRLARQQGWKSTLGMVMRRLEAPSPLGYSCAGEVIAVGEGVTSLRPGDRVACGGNTANHAEVVAVPELLCARIPEGVSSADAAFTTLGAIALQGIRQAGIQAGENVAVIGLGLLGLLSVQLLRASGMRVIAIDLREDLTQKALECGAGLALPRQAEGLEASIAHFTRGLGADAVLITASTDSNDPVELAGILARQKGRVVVVGNVPTGFSRKEYYRKELELRMSMSYGPGRYDPSYEEHGIDYPAGYVRWTENRNMQAFLDFVADGKVKPGLLAGERFPLEQAPEAFDRLLGSHSTAGALLISYDTERQPTTRIQRSPQSPLPGRPGISVIGAGAFAGNMMLPILRLSGKLRGIASGKGLSSKAAMDKFGFAYATGDAEEILTDNDTRTVFILTRHDSHASLAIRAMNAGKHAFVEKPLAITLEELKQVETAWKAAPEGVRLGTGFNRRFAPAVVDILEHLPLELPRAIHIRVNAGKLPPGHWAADPLTGGGRILGEMCHFIDLARCIASSPALGVSASGLRQARGEEDTLTAVVSYADGSIASISYFSNGNTSIPKEEIEVFCGGTVARIHDFRRWEVFSGNGKRHRGSSGKADKGHQALVGAFLKNIDEGTYPPIAEEEIFETMRTTFAVQRALREARTVFLTELLQDDILFDTEKPEPESPVY